MVDYVKLAKTCQRLINKNGREIRLQKLAVAENVTEPWKSAITMDTLAEVICKGVFVVPQTSIPTESRGLAFDWVDQDLLKSTRHVVMVAALGLPDLDAYPFVTDSGKDWKITWGQCLQPAGERLLYVFGLKQ